MFGLFKKKDKIAEVKDIVFATKQAKWKALAEAAQKEPQPVLATWFEDSRDELQQFLDVHQVQAELVTYRQLQSSDHQRHEVIFIEHFPLAAKEKEIFGSLQSKKVTVYSSLDEPFFHHFGGDKIAALMTKMGMQEDEAVSHPLISKAIHNAQEKLAAKVRFELPAQNMEEWMRKNADTPAPWLSAP